MPKMLILMLLLSFGFSASANNNIASYNVTFEDELNLLSINTEIQNNNLSEDYGSMPISMSKTVEFYIQRGHKDYKENGKRQSK